MFKRRRRNSPLKILGLIIMILGLLMFLYIIPLKFWYLIIACLFIIVGVLLFKIF